MATVVDVPYDGPVPSGADKDWFTFGTDGVDGRFGGAHACNGRGEVNLHYWRGPEVMCRTVRCRNHRAAVRVLRRWLEGHNQ